jgi:hypothetical protein
MPVVKILSDENLAGDAVAALESVMLDEGPRQRMKHAPCGRSSIVATCAPGISTRSRADLTRLRIVMAAHPAYDHAIVRTRDEVHPRFGED